MNDETAFLTVIAASPDDDTARLVYADWLDDRGEGLRAECIRRGVKKAKRFTFAPGEPARISYRQDTRRDLPGEVDVTLAVGQAGVSWTTYKGTIDGVTCDWETWRAHGDGLHERYHFPHVRLTELPPLGRDGIYFLRFDATSRCAILTVANRDVELPEPDMMLIRWEVADGLGSQVDKLAERVLSIRWPGVKFDVPKLISANWNSPSADVVSDLRTFRERLVSRMALGFAIPPHLTYVPGAPNSVS